MTVDAAPLAQSPSGIEMYTGHLYAGEESYVPSSEEMRERTRQLDEIYPEINALYLSGVPLFTKETMKSVSQRLKDMQGKCGTVLVRAINGTIVEFAVETGNVLRVFPDTEWVIGSPFIDYSSIQSLTTTSSTSSPRIAYCSLRIHHYLFERDRYSHILLQDMPNESLEASENILSSALQAWEESEQFKQLRLIIEAVNSSRNIRQIVAFACGSMTGDSEDILGKKHGSYNISCYAQDPAYTNSDRKVLHDRSITILDDPEAFLKVDGSTLVISCGPMVPVRQIVLDIARPAMMIWDRVEEEDDSSMLWADPDSSRVRGVIRDFYEEIEFPGEEKHFGRVALYVRRAVDPIFDPTEMPSTSGRQDNMA